MFTRPLIWSHGIRLPLLPATITEQLTAEDPYPLVARKRHVVQMVLLRKELGCASLATLTNFHVNDMVSGVLFSSLSIPCWVMAIWKSTKKAPSFQQVWEIGFEGLSHWCVVNPCMCWEDYLLCSLIIHMQMLPHDPRALKELQRASCTLKDAILVHIITQWNSGKSGERKEVFFSQPTSAFKD